MRSLIFSAIILLTPAFAQAQLVTCGGTDCTFCDFASTVNNVIQFIITVMILIAVLMLVVAGFKLVTSRGNTSAAEAAKKMIFNVVIGIVIVLAAWVLVDTIIKALAGSDLGVWNPIECGGMNAPAGLSDTSGFINEDESNPAGFVTGGNGTSVVPDLDNLTSLRAAGVNVADWNGTNGPGRTDLAHPDVVAAIVQMQAAGLAQFGETPFQVTAAFTEGVGHSAGSQHYNGIAVDIQPIRGSSITNDDLMDLARDAGFTVILDETSHVHVDMR